MSPTSFWRHVQRFNEIEGAQGALTTTTHAHTIMSFTPNGVYTTILVVHPQHMGEGQEAPPRATVGQE